MVAHLLGPRVVKFGQKADNVRVPLKITLGESEGVVVEFQDKRCELKVGEWSGWQEITLAEALTAPKIDDRLDVLELLGRPDAFDISIVEVEGGQVRLESWRYYQFQMRIDFVDGEAVWTFDLEPPPADTIFPAWYDPLAFETALSAMEASRIVAEASPAGAEPQVIDLSEAGDGFEEGIAIVGDQILLAFDGNQLVYVETLAMIAEGGGS